MKTEQTLLRSENRKKNIKEYENGVIRLESRPRILFVELTQNCNLHCDMCRGSAMKYDKKKDMPFELFRRVADELFVYAEIIDLRGWGESTIMPNFMDYVDYALKFNSQYKLYTNMTKRDPKLWEKLIDVGFTLAISFDGANEHTLEKIRGGAKFQMIEENLRLAVSLCKKYNRPLESVYLSCIVQKINLKEIVDLVEFTSTIGMSRLKLFPLMTSWQDKNHLHHYPKEIVNMLDRSFERARQLGVSLELGAALHHDLVIESCVINRCVHPWMDCLIDYRGGISYCDHLIGGGKYVIGDISTSSFDEIWNNQHFVELRQQHVKGKEQGFLGRYIDCDWCYKFRYTDYEHLLYNVDMSRLVSSQTMEHGYKVHLNDEIMDSSTPVEFRSHKHIW